MAMANIVLSPPLSYSPVAITPPHAAAATMSSSPGLPSPSLLLSRMGPNMVGGSRATLFPTNAATGTTLLRKPRSIDEAERLSSIDEAGLFERHELHSGGKVTRETKAQGSEKGEVTVSKKPSVLHEERPETVQEKVPGTTAVRRSPPKSAANAGILGPKKSRKKKTKNESEAQTTIKKTRITKPGTVRPGKHAAGSTKKAKEVASMPAKLPISTQEEDRRAKEEFRGLCIEKAITRRKEWTPCKDTAPKRTILEDVETSVDPKLVLDKPFANAPLTARFDNLLGDFGFVPDRDSSVFFCETNRQGSGEATVKRRKVELVDGVPAPRFPEIPKRCKSPKKKAQTVTQKATAPFAPVETTAAPSLLQYLGACTAQSVIHARDATDDPDTSVKERRRPPAKKTPTSNLTKTKAKKSAPKKSAQKQPILLSPESAMKTAGSQELMFGTSSQLVRDESPTFIRDLQQATKESESMVEHKKSQQKDYQFLDLPSGRPRSSNVRATTASKSLWSAASRDIDGSLVEVEIVNLADTPKPLPTVTYSTTVIRTSDALEPRLQGSKGVERTLERQDVPIGAKAVSDTSSTLQQQQPEPESVMPRSVAEAALKNRPKSKSLVKEASAARPITNQMPNYQGFTDVQLSKEVASNGFKSIKDRNAMIKLLGRCWESKNTIALAEVPVNVSLPQPAKETITTDVSKESSPFKKRVRPSGAPAPTTMNDAKDGDAPPKKPRGRPKKDPTATPPPKGKRKAKAALSEAVVSAADDEIYDSSPPTPSPPRRRSPPKSPDQLPLSSSTGGTTTIAKTAIKDEDQVHLFSQITKAITTFPPSHDPRSLTWYEKMLMYDPIVLEDLTIWLNTEGLDKIGEDDEVSTGLVKEWCEERSVCCLWKENLRGGARGRW